MSFLWFVYLNDLHDPGSVFYDFHDFIILRGTQLHNQRTYSNPSAVFIITEQLLGNDPIKKQKVKDNVKSTRIFAERVSALWDRGWLSIFTDGN